MNFTSMKHKVGEGFFLIFLSQLKYWEILLCHNFHMVWIYFRQTLKSVNAQR
jgi:hypothetical protein